MHIVLPSLGAVLKTEGGKFQNVVLFTWALKQTKKKAEINVALKQEYSGMRAEQLWKIKIANLNWNATKLKCRIKCSVGSYWKKYIERKTFAWEKGNVESAPCWSRYEWIFMRGEKESIKNIKKQWKMQTVVAYICVCIPFQCIDVFFFSEKRSWNQCFVLRSIKPGNLV